MTLLLDGYIRVSSTRGREGDSFISPDLQRDQIAAWAKAKGAEIGAWHTDLDKSGATDNRPGLQEAMRRAEAGETNGIVVAKLDRFARSLVTALDAIKRLDEAGAHFVSVTEGIDPTTPAGKMLQRLMLVLAEFELDRIREGWTVARGRAVKRGVHVASRTPTGYVRTPTGQLEPHPDYGAAITEAMRMRAAGDSWRGIAEFFDERGVIGPYASPKWTPRAAQHVIHNRVYLGEARSGHHVNPDAHKPLTDRATFEAAQMARGTQTARSADPSLLAGLLRCAGCRYALKPDKMTNRQGERVRFYRCRGDHAAGRCDDKAAVLGSVIEPFVVEAFFDLVGDMSATAADGAEIAGIEGRLTEAEAELAAYRDNERIAGALGNHRYVEGLEVRARAVEQTQREFTEAMGRSATAAMPKRAELRALWPSLPTIEKRRLLASAIDCVVLRTGRSLPIESRALIVPFGEAPDDLPRRGLRVPLAPFPWPDPPREAGKAAA